ncbi:pentapeptide repeat-containing protein [cyanobacterium endosymbiont of Rhopalodia gibberula]|uniref:pentapeptide repeat-containing protein n=1 Tax=cyanobacterium endosymbiont of Rhopalodia gibberula TaxID=1763363 RepID=UPI0015596F70
MYRFWIRRANLYDTSFRFTNLAETNVCSTDLTFAQITQARLETTKNSLTNCDV